MKEESPVLVHDQEGKNSGVWRVALAGSRGQRQECWVGTEREEGEAEQ